MNTLRGHLAAWALGLYLAAGLALADAPLFSGPPGSYTVTAPAPVRITQPTGTSFLFDWGGDVPVPPGPLPPPPPPPPPPIPTPGPTPAQGVLHVTGVFDTDTLTVDQAAVRGSVTIAPALKALNAIWHTYEAKSPELDRLNLAGTVKATGLPCLIVQSQDGKLVRALKLTTETDLVNVVKGLR